MATAATRVRVTASTIRVPPDVTPIRIDRYLATALAGQCSRSQLQRLIKEGRVLRNQQPVSASTLVRAGDTLSVEIVASAPPPGVAPEPMPLDILYEDDALIVLNKPAGLVVHPGAGHATGTLVHGLLAHTQRLSRIAGPLKPGIVHRLDKDTSGVMVVAKGDRVHRVLAKQFADRTVERTYVALVHGRVAADGGTINAPLGRHPKDRQRIAVQPLGKGREAITGYRVLRRFPDMTLVELTPKTGRTHQLRVHLKHFGHPILGDPRYGPQQAARRQVPRWTRQALHAHRLGFVHPTTGQVVEFTAPLPQELEASRRA